MAEAHYDIDLLIEEFVHLFEHEADKQAVSLLVNWFHQLMVHGRVPPVDYMALEQEYHSTQEVREMLIEALAKEKQTIRDEGRKEGRKEGEVALRATVGQIIQRRFGSVPPQATALLAERTLPELNDLVNLALDATDLDTFLLYLTPKAP